MFFIPVYTLDVYSIQYRCIWTIISYSLLYLSGKYLHSGFNFLVNKKKYVFIFFSFVWLVLLQHTIQCVVIYKIYIDKDTYSYNIEPFHILYPPGYPVVSNNVLYIRIKLLIFSSWTDMIWFSMILILYDIILNIIYLFWSNCLENILSSDSKRCDGTLLKYGHWKCVLFV